MDSVQTVPSTAKVPVKITCDGCLTELLLPSDLPTDAQVNCPKCNHIVVKASCGAIGVEQKTSQRRRDQLPPPQSTPSEHDTLIELSAINPSLPSSTLQTSTITDDTRVEEGDSAQLDTRTNEEQTMEGAQSLIRAKHSKTPLRPQCQNQPCVCVWCWWGGFALMWAT